jgi:hypothetical protein
MRRNKNILKMLVNASCFTTMARISRAFGIPFSKLVADGENKLKPGGLVAKSIQPICERPTEQVLP